jgi:hypothetical protein
MVAALKEAHESRGTEHDRIAILDFTNFSPWSLGHRSPAGDGALARHR